VNDYDESHVNPRSRTGKPSATARLCRAPDMLSLDAHVLKVLNRRTWQALIE
jgi:hypothetical protein